MFATAVLASDVVTNAVVDVDSADVVSRTDAAEMESVRSVLVVTAVARPAVVLACGTN